MGGDSHLQLTAVRVTGGDKLGGSPRGVCGPEPCPAAALQGLLNQIGTGTGAVTGGRERAVRWVTPVGARGRDSSAGFSLTPLKCEPTLWDQAEVLGELHLPCVPWAEPSPPLGTPGWGSGTELAETLGQVGER